MTVGNDNRGQTISAAFAAKPLVECEAYLFQCSIIAPTPKVLPDQIPVGKIFGEQSPLASCLFQIEDGIDNLPQTPQSWSALRCLGTRQQGFDELPLCICQVTIIKASTSIHATLLPKSSLFYTGSNVNKVRAIDHKGEWFSVKGPLNVPRPPQGYPVLVQAGASEDGREFAAQYAEAIFTAQQTLEDAQEFYADVKARAAQYGRDPSLIKILPGISATIGATEEEAREKEEFLHSFINFDRGATMLSLFLKKDLSLIDLDGPVPEFPSVDEVNGMKSRTQLIGDLARREDLTVRQLIKRLAGGRGHRTFAGTAVQVADQLEEWFTQGAADGFNVMPPLLPGGLNDFTELVVPELRRRGLFRTEYTGNTLREHYGLPRPTNKFSQS